MTLETCLREVNVLKGNYLYLGDGNWNTLMTIVNKTKDYNLDSRLVYIVSNFKYRRPQLASDVLNQNFNRNKKTGDFIGGDIESLYNHFNQKFTSVVVGAKDTDTLTKCIEYGYGLLQNLSYLIVDKNGSEEAVLSFATKNNIQNYLFTGDDHFFIKRVARPRPKVVRTESFKKT